VRAELTLTALQATFWIALIVVSAGAVFCCAVGAQRSRGSLTTLPAAGPLLCWSRCNPDRCPLNVTDLPFGPDRIA
jgi:hypothetical protein